MPNILATSLLLETIIKQFIDRRSKIAREHYKITHIQTGESTWTSYRGTGMRSEPINHKRDKTVKI